jgi:hypothetical protein
VILGGPADGLAVAQSSLAAYLLGPSRAEVLEQRVQTLSVLDPEVVAQILARRRSSVIDSLKRTTAACSRCSRTCARRAERRATGAEPPGSLCENRPVSDASESPAVTDPASLTAEEGRLQEARAGVPWRRWGPYLSERQWGTVREDYSDSGDAWSYFSHDQARSRAYRWGEDGLAGISDDKQHLCLALGLWNERDPILKERLFGLTNEKGNHGEDVKEYYFYVDNLPTHSYQRWLYKYPQAEFPYADLVAVNRSRSREQMEYELVDTGVFGEDRYFDVEVEHAKAGPEDILCRMTVHNRSAQDAALHVLPTLWFATRGRGATTSASLA